MPLVVYNRGVKTEKYDLSQEPKGFTWFNKPKQFTFADGLAFHPEPKTDFWQRTHYGFRKDDGHALLKRITGDFTFTTHARFKPVEQYDQCGLYARIDAANWVKMSIEFEGDTPSKLGSVVTNLGYSDWATQDIGRTVTSMYYRLSRKDSDMLLEWSRDGVEWNAMRTTHLHASGEEIEMGIYACSPFGQGFSCEFSFIEIRDCIWKL